MNCGELAEFIFVFGTLGFIAVGFIVKLILDYLFD